MSTSRKVTYIVCFLIFAIIAFTFYRITQFTYLGGIQPLEQPPTITSFLTPTMTQLPTLNPTMTNSLPMESENNEYMTPQLAAQIANVQPDKTSGWLTFSSKEEGIFNLSDQENFTFHYPSTFKKDYASGPANRFGDGMSVMIHGTTYGLDISTSSWEKNFTAYQKANAYVQSIVNSANCNLYSCNLNDYNITEKKLTEDIHAAVLTGPFVDNRYIEQFFIELSPSKILNFSFGYKQPLDKQSRQEIDLILSSFRHNF